MRGLNHIIFSQLECNENEERVVLRLKACFGLHRAQLHVYLFLCFIFKHTYKTIKHSSKTPNKQWASENSTALKKHSYPDCHTLSIRGSLISRRTRARDEIHARLLLPRVHSYVRAIILMHLWMKLDKNSYPSGNQCFTIRDSKVANKLTELCGGRLLF